jgi:hypothetical protein
MPSPKKVMVHFEFLRYLIRILHQAKNKINFKICASKKAAMILHEIGYPSFQGHFDMSKD